MCGVTSLVHGCLFDGRCLLRCDRTATFLRVGSCLVRTSCAVVGFTLPTFDGGSLYHWYWYGGLSLASARAKRSITRSLETRFGLRLRRHPPEIQQIPTLSRLSTNFTCLLAMLLSSARVARLPRVAAPTGRVRFSNTHLPRLWLAWLTLTLPHLFP